MGSSIRRSNIAAGTNNALDGLKHNKVGAGGAGLTLYGSTAVATGTITFDAEGGNKNVTDLAAVNTEQAADEVSQQVDGVFADVEVGEGEMFLAVAGQVCNFLLLIDD